MKHIPQFTPANQGITATEYHLAILAEIKADDAQHDFGDKIPVRIFSMLDRAFARANAGEFK